MGFAPDGPDIISVIICNYNRAAELMSVLEVVAASEAPIAEVIIVDDASTDRQDMFFKELSSKEWPFDLRIIRNAVNQGASASRNRGIREAKSNLLAFIDSDIKISVDIMPLLLRALKKVDCVFPTIQYTDGSVYTPVDDYTKLYCLNSAVFMIRKHVLSLMDEWFDENMEIYGEDPDFFLRMHAAGGRIQHVSQAVVVHPRRHMHSAVEFYMGYKNTVYMARKLRGIVPCRHPCISVILFHSLRFLISALTGYWLDGVRVTRERMSVGRIELLRLYCDAIKWNFNKTKIIRIKRVALQEHLDKLH